MFKAHLVRLALAAATVSCWPMVAPTQAVAAPSDDVTALIKSASAAFAQQDWDEATAILSKAENQAKAGGLAADKLMARILVHQGAVLVAGADKPSEAVQTFRRALKIDPNAKLTSTLAKPEVLDAFKKAVIMERAEQAGAADAAPAAVRPAAGITPPTDVSVAAGPPPEAPRPTAAPPAKVAPPKPAAESTSVDKAPGGSGATAALPPPKSQGGGDREEPDLPATVPRPLYCPNPDEAPPGKKAVLRCVPQPELDVGRVLLHYRLPGSEDYEKVPATKTPRGWYVAIVPGKAFAGRLFQYYFEARDPTDAQVAENGRYDSPNLMIVREGAPAVTHSATAARVSGDESSVEDSDEEDDDPLSRLSRPSLGEGASRYWVSLSFGRGFGFHGTQELEWYGVEVSGGARSASLLHLWPEFGLRLADNFAVALQGRSQIIKHSGSEPGKPGGPAVGANAVLLRLIWFLPVGEFSNIQLSAIGGGGEGFRLVVPPNEVLMRQSSDTVRGGPFLVGGGIHTDIGFSRTWAMRLGVEVLSGMPKSATVIDFGLGGVFRF